MSDYATHTPVGIPRLSGRSWIEGEPTPDHPGALAFRATNPTTGETIDASFDAATDHEIDLACAKAWEAFEGYATARPARRAGFLDAIAGSVEGLGEGLITLAHAETGIDPDELRAELTRAVGVLRSFAEIVREGGFTRPAINPEGGEPGTPDLRVMLRPVGPVAVFGASNFPIAYSVAGGDTASALAAGCPVVVKGHPLHPGTGELVASAIASATFDAGVDPSVFAYLHAGGAREREIGARLVQRQEIRAVGFTGSVPGGMAIDSLARARHDPVPVYAEMGSINPVFVLPGALERRGDDIVDALFASLTARSGQQCTCPGLLFLPEGEGANAFIDRLAGSVSAWNEHPQTGVMLAARVANQYRARVSTLSGIEGVTPRPESPPPNNGARELGLLLVTDADTFLNNPTLQVETFGPALTIVLCPEDAAFVRSSGAIVGSLTGAIWSEQSDQPLASALVRSLERRVGRLIFDGVPTGVRVCESMHHGGPYPASTTPGSTAQGPRAIERWLRPVSYQQAPDWALPPELSQNA